MKLVVKCAWCGRFTKPERAETQTQADDCTAIEPNESQWICQKCYEDTDGGA